MLADFEGAAVVQERSTRTASVLHLARAMGIDARAGLQRAVHDIISAFVPDPLREVIWVGLIAG